MKNDNKLIPCIFIQQGKAVKCFHDHAVISEDAVELAKQYEDAGAQALIVFDLSKTDIEHDNAIDLMKKINRVLHIPMMAGGNVKRQEDVKKILYAGAKRAILNFAKPVGVELLAEVSKRFGKEKIAVSLENMDTLLKHKELIEAFSDEIIFMQGADIDSVSNITDMPIVLLGEAKEKDEILRILKSQEVKSLECKMDFSEFKLNSDGLIPVIVQDYKTSEVLMMAYMNRDAYEHTLKTGKMTYYSRSRKERWVKGETSGHYQYVKSMMLDCDNDTILAKVEQIGVACHTGAPSCFFQSLVDSDYEEKNPLQVFESVYNTILDRKQNPKEGSYTNYLFDKGIDKILKKVGEEATELVIAAKNPNPEEIKYELSDFLYHAMVLMVERGVTWDDIVKELADR